MFRKSRTLNIKAGQVRIDPLSLLIIICNKGLILFIKFIK
jgi:hypothetical protein